MFPPAGSNGPVQGNQACCAPSNSSASLAVEAELRRARRTGSYEKHRGAFSSFAAHSTLVRRSKPSMPSCSLSTAPYRKTSRQSEEQVCVKAKHCSVSPAWLVDLISQHEDKTAQYRLLQCLDQRRSGAFNRQDVMAPGLPCRIAVRCKTLARRRFSQEIQARPLSMSSM
ncbi:hypothetical protein BCV70DRAFT_16224 [Testicularia cyperi]|uniref:Uncharacterized protein n=1 Tax=Testicularia cyperi TaxID=1882483 RepID=A0A317XYP7_9BASI|nr:hypothetical protein BCV70DRAFT_16224 [Testicularia cyperi]